MVVMVVVVDYFIAELYILSSILLHNTELVRPVRSWWRKCHGSYPAPALTITRVETFTTGVSCHFTSDLQRSSQNWTDVMQGLASFLLLLQLLSGNTLLSSRDPEMKWEPFLILFTTWRPSENSALFLRRLVFKYSGDTPAVCWEPCVNSSLPQVII